MAAHRKKLEVGRVQESSPQPSPDNGDPLGVELKREKEVAFYSAIVDAWINTRLEKDRSLLMLSSAGIGLFVTLLSTKHFDHVQVLLFSASSLCFLITILICLVIFSKNASHLQRVASGLGDRDRVLDVLDHSANCLFLLGILGSLMSAIVEFL